MSRYKNVSNLSIEDIKDEMKSIVGEDFLKQYINRNELLDIFKQQILDIRKNETKYTELKEKVDSLVSLRDISINSSPITFLKTYKKVIEISLELRKILSVNLPFLEQYGKIDYALYWEGNRFATQELDKEWVTVEEVKDKKSGKVIGAELKLDMIKAHEDIEKEYEETGKKSMSSAIGDHFRKYWTALTGMSGLHYLKSDDDIDVRKFGFNRGHAAEAYEEHLHQHHADAIKFFDSQNTINEKVIETFLTHAEKDAKVWFQHENSNKTIGATEMWMHIRHSLGTQAGTVAGDVGSTQVKYSMNYGKAAKEKGWNKIHLTSLKTLQNGIKNYNAIFSDMDAALVAKNMVDYMTENMINTSSRENLINKMSETVYSKTGMKRLDELLTELTKRGYVLLKL